MSTSKNARRKTPESPAPQDEPAAAPASGKGDAPEGPESGPLGSRAYERQLKKLHVELVKLQQWVLKHGLKVCVVFEGRDGAGKGGTMFAMTYHGAMKVEPNYNVMGPVKAALEAACRYLAYELGPQHIRVHAISPGPLKTRAASGLKDFDLMLNKAGKRAPVGELVDIMDVGFTCAYLATPYARRLTGETMYVDGGVNIMA